MAVVRIQALYSKLNESLVSLFDHSGAARVFSLPYLNGQDAADHITAVGQAAQPAGGLTKVLVSTSHRSGGKGWGSPDGSTVGHASSDLVKTIIPKDSAEAIAALSAAKSLLSGIEHLVGSDNKVVKTAQAQLALVAKNNGTGMTLMDFGTALQQLVSGPIQQVAQRVQATKKAGPHPRGTVPEEMEQAPDTDESQTAPDASQQSQGQAPPQAAPQAPAPQSAQSQLAAKAAAPVAQGQ